MKGKGFVGIIVILVVIVAIFGSSYNKLVSLDVAVDGAWAEVNNMLKRRADLIPNLQMQVIHKSLLRQIKN